MRSRQRWRRAGDAFRSRGSSGELAFGLGHQRVAAEPQLGRLGGEPLGLECRLGARLGDGERIPEDLQVRPQPEPARGSLAEDAVKVDEDRLVLAGREAQVRPRATVQPPSAAGTSRTSPCGLGARP